MLLILFDAMYIILRLSLLKYTFIIHEEAWIAITYAHILWMDHSLLRCYAICYVNWFQIISWDLAQNWLATLRHLHLGNFLTKISKFWFHLFPHLYIFITFSIHDNFISCNLLIISIKFGFNTPHFIIFILNIHFIKHSKCIIRLIWLKHHSLKFVGSLEAKCWWGSTRYWFFF